MLGLPATYWYLWTGALINRLGGFVFTFLALYLTQERGFSVEEAGLVASFYGIGSVLSGPVGGALSDRIGRRRTMLLSMVLGAAAMLQLGFARDPVHVAFSTLLLGFLSDLYRPAVQATVADVVGAADRTRAYGYLYWAINLGFSGAAILAGLLARRGFLLLFLLDAGTTLAFGLLVYLRVPETRPAPRDEGGGDLGAPYRDRVFMSFVAVQFLVALVFNQGWVTLPLDMRAHGVSPAQYGSLIAINGVLIVLLQPLAVRLLPRFRRSRALCAGAALTGLGFGLTALCKSPAGYALSIVVWTLGEIVFSPLVPTVIADLAPADLRGSYQGVNQITWGASSFAAPALGSLVLGRLGGRALWGLCLGQCLAAAALHLFDRRPAPAPPGPRPGVSFAAGCAHAPPVFGYPPFSPATDGKEHRFLVP